MSNEFENISINVLYVERRSKEAQVIEQKLQSLGANVKKRLVIDDQTSMRNGGRIEYFSQENSSKVLAQKIADEIRSVEFVSPHPANVKGAKNDFSIWV